MTIYGYVENDEIKLGPIALPTSWKNISNFHLMNPAKLSALGWLPWDKTATPGEVLDRTTIEIVDGRIVQTDYMRERTQAEKDALREREIDQSRRLRQAAYTKESDPIFFRWQRGEATQQEWLDKIAEIKARFPK